MNSVSSQITRRIIKNCFISLLTLLSTVLPSFTQSARAEANIGELAPSFTLFDQNGRETSLDHYLGKYVVLEWFNPSCPFVRKHYRGGDMQKLQAELTGGSVSWFLVNSAHKDNPAFQTAEQVKAFFAEKKVTAANLLFDPTGKTGKAYGAKTTPHFFIIDPKGILIYKGAVDANESLDAKPGETQNFVRQALTEAIEGKAVTVPQSEPYGCSVKYAS